MGAPGRHEIGEGLAHESLPGNPASLQRLNLLLRVLMEAGVVVGLADWGFHTGTTTISKTALAVGAPIVGFGFWGAVDFHQTGRFGEPLRLTQELAVSGLAALACYTAGQHALGLALATLSIIYHTLVYLSGQRLLTSKPHRATGDDAADDRRNSAHS